MSDKPTFEEQGINKSETMAGEQEETPINDNEILVSQVKNGTMLKKLKIKLVDDFTSRKFLILVIAVIAFFIDPRFFPADHLVMTFGIYAGANVLDKLVFWKGRK